MFLNKKEVSQEKRRCDSGSSGSTREREKGIPKRAHGWESRDILAVMKDVGEVRHSGACLQSQYKEG